MKMKNAFMKLLIRFIASETAIFSSTPNWQFHTSKDILVKLVLYNIYYFDLCGRTVAQRALGDVVSGSIPDMTSSGTLYIFSENTLRNFNHRASGADHLHIIAGRCPIFNFKATEYVCFICLI